MVQVAAALVNAVTPGACQGRPHPEPTGAKLVAAVNAAVTVEARRVSRLDTRAARALAAHAARLRPIFVQVEDGDLDQAAVSVNGLLDRWQPTPYLKQHDGEPWHLHFHSRRQDVATSWAASCAVALATVLGGEYATRLGVCSAPACDRVYVDVSRNGTRVFCSTACQSRVKAAAHRARNR